MNDRLDKYFDSLFESAPKTQTVRDLRDEIYSNTLDRYNDFLSQGKSEDESFTKAVSGIGNIETLIAEGGSGPYAEESYYTQAEIDKRRIISGVLVAVSVLLYVICVVPPMFLNDQVGASLMFVCIALATGLVIFANKMKINKFRCSAKIREIKATADSDYTKEKFERGRLLSNIILSVGVALYVCCVVPAILLENELGAGLMFVCIGIATSLVVIYSTVGVKPALKNAETMVEEFKEWSDERKKSYKLMKIIDCVLFAAATVIFLNLGFCFGAWPSAWLVFVIAAIVYQVIKAIFEYRYTKS